MNLDKRCRELLSPDVAMLALPAADPSNDLTPTS